MNHQQIKEGETCPDCGFPNARTCVNLETKNKGYTIARKLIRDMLVEIIGENIEKIEEESISNYQRSLAVGANEFYQDVIAQLQLQDIMDEIETPRKTK